jgi:hypothetical protein
MSKRATQDPIATFEVAERRLFAACAVQIAVRRVRLADPPLAVRVLEAGDGPPLLLVHGAPRSLSGRPAAVWRLDQPVARPMTHERGSDRQG